MAVFLNKLFRGVEILIGIFLYARVLGARNLTEAAI